jgi:hypothetical protein
MSDELSEWWLRSLVTRPPSLITIYSHLPLNSSLNLYSSLNLFVRQRCDDNPNAVRSLPERQDDHYPAARFPGGVRDAQLSSLQRLIMFLEHMVDRVLMDSGPSATI